MTVEYWAQRAKTYDQQEWVHRDLLLDVIGESVSDLELHKCRILDAGTGTGKVLTYLRSFSGAGEYHGCDISDAMLERADPAFHLQRADVMDLSPHYEPGYFDVVTARMVLHHVAAPATAMQQFCKVLRPGGRVVICEGNPPSVRAIDFYRHMFRHKEERHVLMESDLINLLARNGFDGIVTRTVVLHDMSLKDWLDGDPTLSDHGREVITQLHWSAGPGVWEDYDMKAVEGGDLVMNWKFSVVSGVKK